MFDKLLKQYPSAATKITYFDIFSYLMADARLFNLFCKEQFNTNKLFYTKSGSSALLIILEFLKEKNKNNSIAVPAYCSPTIISTIKHAGLKPKYIDINDNLLYILDNINCDDILAVIIVEQFGVKQDIVNIGKYFEDISLILDYAQSFPYQKSFVRKHFAFYSFGRGKSVSLLEGGLVIPSIKESSEFENYFNLRTKMAGFTEFLFLHTKLFLYPILLNKYILNLLVRFPFVSIGSVQESAVLSWERMCKCKLKLGSVIYTKINTILEKRLLRKSIYSELLINDTSLRMLGSSDYSIKIPIIVNTAEHAKIILEVLAYLGVNNGYAKSHLPGFNVSELVKRLIILPNNDYLTDTNIRTICRVIKAKINN